MFCFKCGNSLGDNAKFCAKCGAQTSEPFTSSEQSPLDETKPMSEPVVDTESSEKMTISKKQMARIGLVCVVIIVAFVVYAIYKGLSSDHKNDRSGAQTTAPYTSVASTTGATTAGTTVNVNIVGSCNWMFREENGYSYTLTFSLYNPISDAVAGETLHPDDSAVKLMSTSYDPKTDLVIPATISIKNTSGDFEIYAGYNATIRETAGESSANADVVIDQNFSTGNVNTFLSEEATFGGQWEKLFSSKERRTSHLFIIVKNYYSPNYPEGNIEMLSELTFTPIFYYNEYTCIYNLGFTLSGTQVKYY